MKLKYFIVSITLTFFALMLIIYPDRYISCTYAGICLWAQCVLPSLFPFMVITLIMIKSGIANKTFLPIYKSTDKLHLPSATPSLFLMSICSGYPAGSRNVKEYCNAYSLNSNDCNKLAILCSTSSPLFIIGSVGVKMFASKAYGIKLLLAHLFSVCAVALIYSLKSQKASTHTRLATKKDDNILYDCFYSSVIACIVAGGFITFFYTFAQVICDFNILFPLKFLLRYIVGESCADGICYGLIEATGGCFKIAQSGSKFSLPIVGFLITFGGCSIIAQQLSYLTACKVKAKFFIACKFLQALLCFLLLLPLAFL